MVQHLQFFLDQQIPAYELKCCNKDSMPYIIIIIIINPNLLNPGVLYPVFILMQICSVNQG